MNLMFCNGGDQINRPSDTGDVIRPRSRIYRLCDFRGSISSQAFSHRLRYVHIIALFQLFGIPYLIGRQRCQADEMVELKLLRSDTTIDS